MINVEKTISYMIFQNLILKIALNENNIGGPLSLFLEK